MLYVVTAGEQKQLWGAFEQNLRNNPNANLLEPDTIIVPNRDVSRWIQVQRTRQTGISANLSFVLPAHYIHQLNLQIDAEYEKNLPDKFRMGWMVYSELLCDPDGRKYESLYNYVQQHAASGDGFIRLRRYQLAVKIADIYDQYQLFRPDWIQAWSDGVQPEELQQLHIRETAHWQMQLWQALSKKHPAMITRPQLHKTLIGAAAKGETKLPATLHVFMTGTVPPVYNEAIIALAHQARVFVYRISPEAATTALPDSSPHPLMIQMGEEHADLDQLLADAIHNTGVEVQYEIVESGDAPKPSDTMLEQIQRDIRTRSTSPFKADTSIQIHACHNPLREIEVLQDQIIHFLEQHPDAGPSDVLVVAPQLSDHITGVHAVFGNPASEKLRLAYHIHDPSGTATGRLFELLQHLMMVERSRFKAGSLMELIDREPIRRRFGLSSDDISLIEYWIRETGVRWGLDGDYRGDKGIFSWQFGMERLLMGIMQPVRQQKPVLDVLPFPDVEGADQLRVAGIIMRIFRELKSWSEFSRTEHSPGDWQSRIRTLAETFLPQETEDQLALMPVMRAVDRLKESLDYMPQEELFPLDVACESLREQIKERTAGSGYRKGGITFSTMVPVRHLPFRFVAVLGLNENSFPGREQASGFDLMLKEARKGDRQKRISNRALFLDALRSAGNRLHLSYVGYSFKDGSEIAPSLVVKELIDVIQSGLTKINEAESLDSVWIKHRLHGFHQEYLTDASTSLFTYDETRADLLKSLSAGLREDSPVQRFDAELPGDEEQQGTAVVELDSLLSLLKHPVRWMMEGRGGMRLQREEEAQEDRDIFDLGGLSNYMVNQELLKLVGFDDSGEADKAEHMEELKTLFRLKGMLPYETAGDLAIKRLIGDMREFMDMVRLTLGDIPEVEPELVQQEIQVQDTTVLLRGSILPPVNGRSVVIHYAEAKPRRMVQVWIEHLMMVLIYGPAMKTVYVSKQKKSTDPVIYEISEDQPEQRLSELLQYYSSLNTLPLPATASALSKIYEYETHKEIGDDKKASSALGKVYSYFGGENKFSYDFLESDDPYAAIFYGEYSDELQQSLPPLAQLIWGPIIRSFESKEV